MASFEIVELDKDGKARPFPAGVFPDGKSAASILSDLQARYPDKKFQPRPIKDETNNWRGRETRRFEEKLYEPLGLDITPITDHYAHRALKVPANVAFTRNPAEGQIDKQASVHIRAYLNEFYPNLSVEEKRKLIWDYCGEAMDESLFFAVTADEIEHVYQNGPSSCMAYDTEYYGTKEHPTRAYAGPDLQIAYIKTPGGKITARAICWPAKKIYGAPYGDYVKLKEALKEAGYRNYDDDKVKNSFHGARLSLIWQDDYYHSDHDENYEGYLCPYIDVSDYVAVKGDYLVMQHYSFMEDRTSIYDCQSTSGVCRG